MCFLPFLRTNNTTQTGTFQPTNTSMSEVQSRRITLKNDLIPNFRVRRIRRPFRTKNREMKNIHNRYLPPKFKTTNMTQSGDLVENDLKLKIQSLSHMETRINAHHSDDPHRSSLNRLSTMLLKYCQHASPSNLLPPSTDLRRRSHHAKNTVKRID